MSKARRRPTAGTSQQKKKSGATLSLAAAQRMIPLIRHIVGDVHERWTRLAQLEREQTDLEKRRRDLDWPERARRYGIGEEITQIQRGLHEAVLELEQLEVVLVDPAKGEVAFPTSVNGRRAYFLWELVAEGMTGWCYASDSTRHAIPANWHKDE